MRSPATPEPDVWDLIEAGQGPSPGQVSRLVDREAVRLGRQGVREAESALLQNTLGAGPVQHLLDDPLVTDVLVNGAAGVWVDRGEGLRVVPCQVGDEGSVRRLAVRLAGLAGRRLDDACPCVDGLLPGGIRLHAILPPIVQGGAHISLRVPQRSAPTLEQLIAWATIPPAWSPVFRALIDSRTSFVVTGGTGTGKTTLLAALLGLVAADQRIILVEEVRELAVDHPHVVRLQSRPANVENRGAVGLDLLVRQSLRMRPDRLVVGEVRGAEVRELLSALNTGHDGGCGTLHANGIADVVARMEALGALAGLAPAATRAQLASAVQVVVHLRRCGAVRFVESIGVLGPCDGALGVRPALRQVVQSGGSAQPWCSEPAPGHGVGVHCDPENRLVPRREADWPLLASAIGLSMGAVE